MLRASKVLRDFVDKEVLPGTGVSPQAFWSGLAEIAHDLAPKNAALLEKRDKLQAAVDQWFKAGGNPANKGEYQQFLQDAGYLVPEEAPFQVSSENVDPEIATLAGPQLVCPSDNARFLLNAANARWGSLLDALYGTNAMLGPPPKGPYDAKRGEQVFAQVHALLDELFPLANGQWADVSSLAVADGSLRVTMQAEGSNKVELGLREPSQLAGYNEEGSSTWSLLLEKNGLHAELIFDASGTNKRSTQAGLVDVKLESALSTICDLEDSACTVDADDKVVAYRNWLGLMKRTLSADVPKADGSVMKRSLNSPKTFRTPKNDASFELPGNAVLLCRNVGMHMPTNMVTTAEGIELPEHFVDAMVSGACALHDLKLSGDAGRNSRTGSMYVVKPKMHGPEEVALACELFSRVEDVLGMPRHTMKMGVMDEERRTSANLYASIKPAKERLVFVNTGFLDRTGDEIHTSMHAGPMQTKAGCKQAQWYGAYETSNVEVCLAAELVGKGQIGKGMWAEPDDMATMLKTKGAQLDMGASTAWVPSPTAATLHALHYMRTSVKGVQTQLARTRDPTSNRQQYLRDEILTPPLMQRDALSAQEVQSELDDSCQSLLGYVARWVGMGVGCSKVPNLAGTQLMEDRATLRISSQLIANWLHHGIVSEDQVKESLKRMAKVVDQQNANDKQYHALAPGYDGPEWNAAIDLVFDGVATPNGYTETALTKWRRERKAMDAAPERVQAKFERALADHMAAEGVSPATDNILEERVGEALKDQVERNNQGAPYRRRGNSFSGAI